MYSRIASAIVFVVAAMPLHGYAGDGQAQESLGVVVRSIGVLALVCTLAAVSIKAAGRRFSRGSGGPVELLARVPIEPRRSVLLVRVGDQVFVVGSSEAGLVTLGEVPVDVVCSDDVPLESAAAGSAGFAAAMARVSRGLFHVKHGDQP